MRAPFGREAVLARDERQAHAHRWLQPLKRQVLVERAPQRSDIRPLGIGMRPADARRRQTPHAQALAPRCRGRLEIADAIADDWKHARRLRRARERDVALGDEDSHRRVEPDPARPRNVRLAPGVQGHRVREAGRRAVVLLVGQAGRDSRRRSAPRAPCAGASPSGARRSPSTTLPPVRETSRDRSRAALPRS